MPPCPGCEAYRHILDGLQKQIADLQDKLVAMANPVALAVARGQMIAPTQVATPLGTADGVDDQGAYVVVDGRRVPMEEWMRAQTKLAEMTSQG